MKKRTFTICAAAAMVLGSLNFASAQGGIKPPVDTDDAPEHKVYICHFPGHDEDEPIPGAQDGTRCNELGGIILLVANKGACKGHKIDPRRPFCREAD